MGTPMSTDCREPSQPGELLHSSAAQDLEVLVWRVDTPAGPDLVITLVRFFQLEGRSAVTRDMRRQDLALAIGLLLEAEKWVDAWRDRTRHPADQGRPPPAG